MQDWKPYGEGGTKAVPGTLKVCSQLHGGAAFLSGKDPLQPLHMRLGGPHMGLYVSERKYNYSLSGIEPQHLDCSVRSQVITLNEP